MEIKADFATTGAPSQAGRPMVRVTLVRSPIGAKPKTRGTLRALGLRRIGQSRFHEESDPFRGMLKNVAHLVDVSNTVLPGNPSFGGGTLVTPQLAYSVDASPGRVFYLDDHDYIFVESYPDHVSVGWTTQRSTAEIARLIWPDDAQLAGEAIVYQSSSRRNERVSVKEALATLRSSSDVEFFRIPVRGGFVVWERLDEDGSPDHAQVGYVGRWNEVWIQCLAAKTGTEIVRSAISELLPSMRFAGNRVRGRRHTDS